MQERAVARRWAEALYALAKDQGRQAEVLEQLVGLKSHLDDDRELSAALLNPRVETERKEQMLDERLFNGRDPQVCQAIRLMIRRRRLDAFKHFFSAYLEVHEAREGIKRFRLETASAVSDTDRDAIAHRLHEVTGSPVIIDTAVRPELLGGMRLVCGSQVVDGSVRGRLDRLTRTLRELSVS